MKSGQKIYGGNVEGRVWINQGAADVKLRDGYPTTANGSASDIIVPAGLGLVKEYRGDPEEFARYRIVDHEEAQAEATRLQTKVLIV